MTDPNDIKTQFLEAKKLFDTMPTKGTRLEIPRQNADSIQVILYTPEEKADNLPLYVYCHGGAWIAGDAVQMDDFCLRMAKETPAVVLNLNYRKLVEQPFPYPQQELMDAVKWARANSQELHIAPEKVVISGGSAGGHIAAGAAILLAKEGIRISGQILEVPFLDFTYADMADTGMFPELTNSLHKEYFPELALDDPIVSPSLAPDEILRTLPPTEFLLGSLDPICTPQAVRFAERLRAVGVAAQYEIYEAAHGLVKVSVDADGNPIQADDYCNQTYMDYRTQFIRDCTKE